MPGLARSSLVAALCAGCASPTTPPSIVVPFAEPTLSDAPGPRPPAPCRPAPPSVAPVATPDRGSLAVGLDPFLAGMVLDERTDLVARAAPFLAHGRIWDLEHFGHAHPFYAHVGELPGAPSVALSSSASFVAFARSAGLVLDTEAARAAYVKTFVALDPDVLVLLESGQDIRFDVPRERSAVSRELLDLLGPAILEEVERRRYVEDHLAHGIAPVCLRGAGPCHGVVYAIKRQQKLVRIEVTLEKSGAVAAHEVILAERVPVPMVYP